MSIALNLIAFGCQIRLCSILAGSRTCDVSLPRSRSLSSLSDGVRRKNTATDILFRLSPPGSLGHADGHWWKVSVVRLGLALH